MARGRRLDVAGLLVGGCLLTLGAVDVLQPAAAQDVGVVPGVGAPAPSGADRPVRPSALPVAPAAPVPAPLGTVPVRLRIARLGVDAPVRPVGLLPAGGLDVPEDPATLGWWSGGGRAGQEAGSTVLDGHVDSARLGRGAFFRLVELQPGDALEVVGQQGQVLRYVVTGRRQYAKSTLPVAEVFGQPPQPRLVLVTCGGAFDRARRSYADNVAVYAVPAV